MVTLSSSAVKILHFFVRCTVHQYAKDKRTEEMDFRRILQLKRNAISFQRQRCTACIRFVLVVFVWLYTLDSLLTNLTVSGVVHSMQLYPLEEVLTAPYLISEWRPDLIEDLQKELSPHTCRIIVVGQKLEPIANSIEKWYGTKYHWEKLDKNVLEVSVYSGAIVCWRVLIVAVLSCRNGQTVDAMQIYHFQMQIRSYRRTSICIRLKRICKKFRSSFTIRR